MIGKCLQYNVDEMKILENPSCNLQAWVANIITWPTTWGEGGYVQQMVKDMVLINHPYGIPQLGDLFD
jgi:hypothetical protein